DPSPGPFHHVQSFPNMTARRNGPYNVGGIGNVDVVVYDHNELSSVRSRACSCGDEQRLFGVARIALMDGHDSKWSRLAAVNEPPNALNFGNPGFFQLFPQGCGAERNGQIACRWFERRRAEEDRIVAVVNALHYHHGSLADVCV